MSFIEFNGGKSSDFYLVLEPELTFNSPSRNIDFQHIPGQDGDIGTGDGTFSNGSKSFPFNLLPPKGKTVEGLSTDISNWLKKDTLWHDLLFNEEPDYVYRAMYYEEYDVERVISQYGKCVLKFAIKPYKFLKSGLTPLSSPASLNNPTTRDARPLITIKGTGNITLQIGSEKLTLKGVDGGVVIDSLKQVVTNLAGTAPAWDKVTSYPLPVIKPGKQAVLTTGTVTSLTIVPRYEVIV